MSNLVFNKRTGLWTDERVGVNSVEEYTPATLRKGLAGWVPTGDYLRYWEQVAFQKKSGLDVLMHDDPESRRLSYFVVPQPLNGFWPCLNLIQVLVRGSVMTVFFYWRSSSDAERRDDNAFMQWAADQFVFEAPVEVRHVVIHSFRASDHIVLGDKLTGGG